MYEMMFLYSGRYSRWSYHNWCAQQRCSGGLWEQKDCTHNEVRVTLYRTTIQSYSNCLYRHSLSNEYRSNASLITDHVMVETQSNAASTLPAPPYIPPPSFASLGHCSSLSTIDRPVMSRSGTGWNNYVIAESDVFEEPCSSVEKVQIGSESDEYDGKCSSVSTSNKCATFV